METQTQTVPVRNGKARIYRNANDKWVVLIRDSVYDGSPTPRYVSQRDFDMLSDAQDWAREQTGKEASVSI